MSYSLTSLGPDRAGPEELLSLVRNHLHIENRLHYVRDFTYEEDRCRVHVRHLPRNLACLTNVAIAIVRSNGRFRHLPESSLVRHRTAQWHGRVARSGELPLESPWSCPPQCVYTHPRTVAWARGRDKKRSCRCGRMCGPFSMIR